MGAKAARVLLATAACLLWLNGCESSTQLGGLFQSTADPAASGQEPASTGSVRQPGADAQPKTVAKGSAGTGAEEELGLGKTQFRAGSFARAARHFRRAVELNPRDLESWLGLAASYDRLRRFQLADRAYDQAVKIAGPTSEILNNRGYSYLLRGDPRRAHEALVEAQAKDPGNANIKKNLDLLEANLRKGKTTQ
ncbi:MAG: tetratricopeptide repeat protein [Xanthobacteraceae bacterium]